MVVQTATSSTASNFVLAPGDELLVADGIQIWRTGGSVITGQAVNQIFLAPNSAVLGFEQNGQPAITLSNPGSFTKSNVDIAPTASIQAIGSGVTATSSATSGTTVTNNGSVTSRGFFAINLEGGGDNRIVNAGVASADQAALRVVGSGRIDNTGLASGEDIGVQAVTGGATIFNSGVVAGNTGVSLAGGQQTFAHRLTNTGEISGRFAGVASVSQETVIVNSGEITSSSASDATIAHQNTDANRAYRLTNSGEIVSAGFAYEGSLATDLIENSGMIVGRVSLGEGSDIYVGRHGLQQGPVFGDGGFDLLVGGEGADDLFGGSEADVLRGLGADDVLRGGTENDQLFGGNGDDELFGEGGEDTLRGNVGNDRLDGGLDADEIFGGRGDDDLKGAEAPDLLRGGRGDDLLDGGIFSDRLFGGLGDDELLGGGGFDRLQGGRGDDALTGGAASDVFVMRRRNDDDVILDFQNGMDQVDLTAFGLRPAQFAAVVAPALNDAGGGAAFLDLGALGGAGSVLIQGLAFAQADASDFIL